MKKIIEYLNQKYKKYDPDKIKIIADKFISEELTEKAIIFWFSEMEGDGSSDVSQSKQDFEMGWDAALDYQKFLKEGKV